MRRTVTVAVFWFFSNNVWVPTNGFSGKQPLPALYTATRDYSGGIMFDRRLIFSTRLGLIPPPGSGYAGPEEEVDVMPSSYEPMMEYPGTFRPGRTPENMPFHDLPIGDDDPDPVPWPHFQQIEWHHRWEPPHPHPIPMEEFIEQQGRWATPEMEAEMRAGSRRASRTRREMEEEQKRDTLIMDDDDDDDDMGNELPQELGEGMFGQLGSTDDAKIIADATSPDRMDEDKEKESGDGLDDGEDDSDLDDFLLDLGLDSLGDEDEEETEKDVEPIENTSSTAKSTGVTRGLEDIMITDDDDDDSNQEEETINPDVTASIDVDDDDDDLDLMLDDEDGGDLDDSMEVPLEDFGDESDMDVGDFFDDGGFDYDDGDSGGDFDDGF